MTVPPKKPNVGRFFVALALILLPALMPGHVRAQVGRRSSAVAANVSAWPAASALERGSTLLITIDSPAVGTYECKLQEIDDTGIQCRGPHRRSVLYERRRIRSISVRTHRLRDAYIGFVVTGAVLAGSGFICIVAGGGAPCAAILSAGLVSGLIAGILHSVHELRGPGEPLPVYIAPDTDTDPQEVKTNGAAPASNAASSQAEV